MLILHFLLCRRESRSIEGALIDGVTNLDSPYDVLAFSLIIQHLLVSGWLPACLIIYYWMSHRRTRCGLLKHQSKRATRISRIAARIAARILDAI